jgi:type IV secretion system protein VirB10
VTEDATVPTPLPKIDPETLAIRARPGRAIRFRRGVIIAIAAIGSVSLIAVAWMALKPRSFLYVADGPELSQPSGNGAGDALNGLPASYANVPQLGPPLPGDLGKPILEHRRSLGMDAAASEQQASQAEAAERERQAAELKAARESGVFVQGRQAGVASADATPAVSDAGAPANNGGNVALDPDRDPNAQKRKAQFVGTLDPRGDVNPHLLTAAPSPYLLSAGSLIAASLTTGLRSDLPGLVTAQVTENVYDSPTGRILLIPQGARLIGSYDSVVAFGQRRAGGLAADHDA